MPSWFLIEMKKNRSFLIEILRAGPTAASALTICGRGPMTLSVRGKKEWGN
jgi:hypothetical protein